MAEGDLVEITRRLINELDQSKLDMLRAELSEQLSAWDPEPWIAERWAPLLDAFAGTDRKVTDVRQVNGETTLTTFAGSSGQGYVTVFFDEIGKISGLSIDRNEPD